jgi:DNA-binding protein Fis
MNKPKPGEYFISTNGHFCEMISHDLYHDHTFNSSHAHLYFIDHCPHFGKLRDATAEEIKQHTVLDTTNQGENKMETRFEIELVEGHNVGEGLKQLESAYIEFVHKLSRFNQSRTARSLGISRGCLRAKLKEYFGEKYI